jgi:hypothetical protein
MMKQGVMPAPSAMRCRCRGEEKVKRKETRREAAARPGADRGLEGADPRSEAPNDLLAVEGRVGGRQLGSDGTAGAPRMAVAGPAEASPELIGGRALLKVE